MSNELPEIYFKTIPNSEQRYPTVGDYWMDELSMQFRVSSMKNPDYEFLVFIHELVEWYLTQKRGISEESITAFDEEFEKLREEHPNIIGDQEPGHMVSAPYHKEHVVAEWVEKTLAMELGVDWKKYSSTIEKL